MPLSEDGGEDSEQAGQPDNKPRLRLAILLASLGAYLLLCAVIGYYSDAINDSFNDGFLSVPMGAIKGDPPDNGFGALLAVLGIILLIGFILFGSAGSAPAVCLGLFMAAVICLGGAGYLYALTRRNTPRPP